MKKSIVYVGFLALLSALQPVAFAAYNQESYGVTALSAQKVSVQSCTPGINAVSRQIETGGQDISGSLPFNRTYQSALQLGFNSSTRSEAALITEKAFALTSIEDRELFGAGWSHNYDYQLTAFGTQAYILSMPGGGLPIFFAKQNDGSIKLSNSDLIPISQDTEYKIKDDGVTVTININGTVITFKSLSGQRGPFQRLQSEKLQYAGGKTISMSHSKIIKNNIAVGYLLTGVSDNIGNSITINRSNMSGSDTSVLGLQSQGSISSVETSGNTVNKQIASYSYEFTPVVHEGKEINVRKLTQVVTTIRGTENYSYNDYNHMGLFKDAYNPQEKDPNKQRIRGMILPLLSEYRHQNQTVMTWSATSSSLTSSSPSLFSASINYTENVNTSQLSITSPGSATPETYTITNGYTNTPNINAPAPINGANARYVRYTTASKTPCLNINGVPLKDFAIEKNSRTLATFTDKNNNRTDLQYDTSNRLLEKTEAKGSTLQRKTTMTYTTGYAIPNTVKVASLTLTNSINELGQVYSKTLSSSQTDSFDKVTNYTYYPNGLLSTVTPVRSSTNGTVSTNDTVSYTYDDWGNVATETRYRTNFSTNVQTSLVTKHQEYNSAGQPKRTVYPDGRATEYTYNNRLQKTQQRTGIWNGSALTGNILSQTWAYNDLNQVTSACDADSVCTFYHLYDALSRPIIVTKNDGSYTTYSYHPNNTPASVIQRNAQGVISAQQYYTLDANGRVEQERSGATAGSNTVNKTYDANGNLSTSTTANGLKDSWTYDALNRVETHTDPAGKITTKNYDLEDNLKTNTDPIGQTFQYNYRNGGVKSFDSTNSLINTQYQTDALDNIKSSQTDTRQCAYPLHNEDNLAHVKDCQTDNAPFRRVYELYHYNNLTGLLEDADQHYPNSDANLSGKGSRTTYSYDEHQRLSAKVQYNKKLSPQPLVNGYGYTNGGRLAAIQYPSGRSVTYTYDNAGRVNGVYNNNAALITNISYDGSDRYTGWSWGWWQGSQVQQEYVYDANTHQLTQVNHLNKNSGKPPLLGTCAGYDRDGRVNSLCDSFGQQYQISLDSLGRVTTNKKLSNNQTQGNYTYDDNGNRTVAWSDRPATYYDRYQYSGNKQTGLSRNDAPQPITQIAEGIIATNQLIPVYDATGRRLLDTQANGTVGWYHYNHKNERTYKQVGTEQARQFAYDEAGHLIGEYTLAGAAINEYIWLGDTPIAVIRNGILHYITADALNTPRVITNASNGSVVWAWSYEGVFGEVAPVNYQPTAFDFNLRFAGQYADAHSGLFYNHNRYYSPRLGRYMEPDPIGLAGGLNPYAYAGSNPVMNVDSSGLQYRASKQYSLGTTFTTRLDLFPYQNETRHEFHIFNNGKEVGMFSEGTFFNKHGKIMEIPAGFDSVNMNRLKGLDIEVLRKMERFPARGSDNIKGLDYREKIVNPIPRHEITNLSSLSRAGRALGYFGIAFVGRELYTNPAYTIDNAFMDITGISQMGDSSIYTPNISFPADSSGNSSYYINYNKE